MLANIVTLVILYYRTKRHVLVGTHSLVSVLFFIPVVIVYQFDIPELQLGVALKIIMLTFLHIPLLDMLCVFVSLHPYFSIWNARIYIVALQLAYCVIAVAAYLCHYFWPHSRGAEFGYGILSLYVMLVVCLLLGVAAVRQYHKELIQRLFIPIAALVLLSLFTSLSLYIPSDYNYLVAFLLSLIPLVEIWVRLGLGRRSRRCKYIERFNDVTVLIRDNQDDNDDHSGYDNMSMADLQNPAD
jgi:hypothetical protein